MPQVTPAAGEAAHGGGLTAVKKNTLAGRAAAVRSAGFSDRSLYRQRIAISSPLI